MKRKSVVQIALIHFKLVVGCLVSTQNAPRSRQTYPYLTMGKRQHQRIALEGRRKMNAYEWGVKRKSCKEALELRKGYDSQADWYKACKRGDWLLWQLRWLPYNLEVAVTPHVFGTVRSMLERVVWCGVWQLRYTDSEAVEAWCAYIDGLLSGDNDVAHVRFPQGSKHAIYLSYIQRTLSHFIRTKRFTLEYGAAIVDSVINVMWDMTWTVGSIDSLPAIRAIDAANVECAAELARLADDIHKEIPEWPGSEDR